ncbi:MAG TPA: methionyl-tRNA formyltransferase [Gemmatimonadaceae bacterium]|nr:methionyl-tRNA formyltransferase [Gemmatimonadaceae bacterium]
MRIVFWGTPEFATPSLRALIGEGHDVVGVVTQPDRPQGRSRSKLVPSPVKMIALEEGLPVLQPEQPRTPDFIDALRAFDPDASVVVAYGRILNQTVIDTPRLGTFNVHASMLPQLRGAAPIQAAILEGMAETGVTIMRLVPALDAGPMLLRRATPIAEDETYGELALRLAELGALALIEALTLLDLGIAIEQQQDDAMATYAPKVDREHTKVDWTQPATQVARVIRAYDPRPGAYTTSGGAELKLYGATLTHAHEHPPGSILGVDSAGVTVACGEGAVCIAFVQPAGKPRMAAEAWARGRGRGAARLG